MMTTDFMLYFMAFVALFESCAFGALTCKHFARVFSFQVSSLQYPILLLNQVYLLTLPFFPLLLVQKTLQFQQSHARFDCRFIFPWPPLPP